MSVWHTGGLLLWACIVRQWWISWLSNDKQNLIFYHSVYKDHFWVWSYTQLLPENRILMEISHLRFSQRFKFAIVSSLSSWLKKIFSWIHRSHLCILDIDPLFCICISFLKFKQIWDNTVHISLISFSTFLYIIISIYLNSIPEKKNSIPVASSRKKTYL